jgi:hypothetical protein
MQRLTPSTPTICNTLRGPISNVTFLVTASRHLSRPELLAIVRDFYAQPKIRRRKKPFRNTVVRLQAREAGADEGAPTEPRSLASTGAHGWAGADLSHDRHHPVNSM